MQFAIVANGTRRQPEKTGERATCPLCEDTMVAKCGTKMIHHWAHKSNDCDPWAEPLTRWHAEWQNRITGGDTTLQEIVIEKHRLDCITPAGDKVEIQHSTINAADIKERQEFYSTPQNPLLWVFNRTSRTISEDIIRKSDTFAIKLRTAWAQSLDAFLVDFRDGVVSCYVHPEDRTLQVGKRWTREEWAALTTENISLVFRNLALAILALRGDYHYEDFNDEDYGEDEVLDLEVIQRLKAKKDWNQAVDDWEAQNHKKIMKQRALTDPILGPILQLARCLDAEGRVRIKGIRSQLRQIEGWLWVNGEGISMEDHAWLIRLAAEHQIELPALPRK